jgi:hypothetical protein
VIGRRLLAACLALGLAVALLACSDDDGGGDGASPAASPEATPLTMAEWAVQVCAFSVEAADTLDVPGTDDPSTLTLEEREERAADVLAPRAEALSETAEDIAALEPPEEAAGFNAVIATTMADVAAAWLDLVAVAETARTGDDLDTANQAFLNTQNEADRDVIAAYQSLGADAKAAVSQEEDCGVLNDIRS